MLRRKSSSVFSTWFAFALLDFGVILGLCISAVDSYFSVDAVNFDAGTEAVISVFVQFVPDFVTEVVTDFSSSVFGPDLDFHTIWASVAGMVSAGIPETA